MALGRAVLLRLCGFGSVVSPQSAVVECPVASPLSLFIPTPRSDTPYRYHTPHSYAAKLPYTVPLRRTPTPHCYFTPYSYAVPLPYAVALRRTATIRHPSTLYRYFTPHLYAVLPLLSVPLRRTPTPHHYCVPYPYTAPSRYAAPLLCRSISPPHAGSPAGPLLPAYHYGVGIKLRA